jgi:hypothetical protein
VTELAGGAGAVWNEAADTDDYLSTESTLTVPSSPPHLLVEHAPMFRGSMSHALVAARRGAVWLRSLLLRTNALAQHEFDRSFLDSRIVWTGLRGTARGADDDASSPPPHAVHVDPAPFLVAAATPMPKVHYLLCVCLFAELFVTRDGRLAGVIVKDDLGDGRRVSRERLLMTVSTVGDDSSAHA